MKYSHTNDLEKFLKECEKRLLSDDNKQEVRYPSVCVPLWDSERINEVNETLLSELKHSANVYAIFTAEKGSKEYALKYIGQTISKLAKTRLTNHLIKKHSKTGAKLSKVIDHVQSGGKIKISWISITPESLRHYIEEELIERHPESIWNKHARKKVY